MPGIVGFTIAEKDRMNARRVLQKMQNLIIHGDFYEQDELFCDNQVCATRAHINVLQKQPQPYYEQGVYVWLDGEFFNTHELAQELLSPVSCDTALLSALYRQQRDFSFLKQIDGSYAAVIYDSKEEKVHLLTDRYGLRPLYWLEHAGQLVWSSEAKAMIALPGWQAKIDPRAVKQFLNIGLLLEDRSWFQGVELLSSGSVLTWDLRERRFYKRRYWWWDEIKAFTGRIKPIEIADELGRLFVQAVQKRDRQGEKVGLMLSGGLDSRAILAAMPNHHCPIHGFTFGCKSCDDIRLAARVAKVKGATHHVFELDASNWLLSRVDGVWWTDGECNIYHMHGIDWQKEVRATYEINLDGIGANTILGGCRLHKNFFDTCPDRRFIAGLLKCDPALLGGFDDYSSAPKMDSFFLQNQTRRIIAANLRYRRTFVENREPFYDTNLVEFIYALPDSLRYRGQIYNLALIRRFPEFFNHIPWEQRGVPISWPDIALRIARRWHMHRRSLIRGLNRLGFKYGDRRHYTDYPNWLRAEPSRSFFERVLNNPVALYSEYISRQPVLDKWHRHLRGENFTDILCRVVTFEIWLQQIFAGKHRPTCNVQSA